MSDQQDEQESEDDDSILDELKGQLFAFAIYGLIALFFYGFVQLLASFEPKTRAKFDDVPVETRLANLPAIFKDFYQRSQDIFREQLPPMKYWNFVWNYQKLSYKLYKFEISQDIMSEQQFNDIYQPRLIAQGWSQIPNQQEKYYAIQIVADYTFVDASGNRTFITHPKHNAENPTHWKVYMVENSGIFAYQK